MKERNNKYRCTFAFDDEHHQGERQEAARGPATMSDDGTSDDEEAHDDLAGDWHFGGHLGVDVEDDDEEERPRKKRSRLKGSKNTDWSGNFIQDLDGNMRVDDARKILMSIDGRNWKRKCGGGQECRISYVATCALCPGVCENEVSCIKISTDMWHLQSNGNGHSASGGLLP